MANGHCLCKLVREAPERNRRDNVPDLRRTSLLHGSVLLCASGRHLSATGLLVCAAERTVRRH